MSESRTQVETPLYRAGQVKKHFPVLGGVLRRTKGYVKALDGVDLEIFRGETISIIGESGCGKTTLGRMLAPVSYTHLTLPTKRIV